MALTVNFFKILFEKRQSNIEKQELSVMIEINVGLTRKGDIEKGRENI